MVSAFLFWLVCAKIRKADFNFKRGREESEKLPSFPLVIPCRYYGIQALTREYSAVKIRLQQYGQECCTNIFMIVLLSILSKGKLFENTYRTFQKYTVLLRAQLAWQKKPTLFLFLLSESYKVTKLNSVVMHWKLQLQGWHKSTEEESRNSPIPAPPEDAALWLRTTTSNWEEEREFLCKKSNISERDLLLQHGFCWSILI